jgi:hypothetical protein
VERVTVIDDELDDRYPELTGKTQDRATVQALTKLGVKHLELLKLSTRTYKFLNYFHKQQAEHGVLASFPPQIKRDAEKWFHRYRDRLELT